MENNKKKSSSLAAKITAITVIVVLVATFICWLRVDSDLNLKKEHRE